MKSHYDVAVVGAGVLGLAHAYHLARRGLKTVVFERTPHARGASVRNFGMLWPIGQPPGPRYRLARRSLEIWREVLQASGLWYDSTGSLHLAYHDDEAQVLDEFVHLAGDDCSVSLLDASAVTRRFPALNPEGLRGGMWSDTEVTVDPRQVIAGLPGWLNRTLAIDFVFGTSVLGYDRPVIRTTGPECRADRLVVCTGADFRELAPQSFAEAGLVPCKLQMMRSAPYGPEFRVGTMLAAGLTLRHYQAFSACPSLPALIQRFDSEMPEYGKFGIHVLLSQNGLGELVIGDSHEYGAAISPFDNSRIDELVLQYLRTFINIPDLRIAARWHGVYVKHPTDLYVVAHPQPGMMAVTGVGGAGMTLSFGLAEQTIHAWLGDSHG
ncbi:MAG: TIGR03364 family FAD-dependent oxidoreductase [Planctomycetes bacterium]|nr:TIGR03364 family FAD-dependent oxidoreductase [Planctomycetota bacterium]